MSYTIASTTQAMKIAERKYATASEIRFTKFTSCIGVLGIVSGKVCGVHLSIADQAGATFDDAAAQAVAKLFASASSVTIIGKTSYWEDARNGVSASYAKLKKLLGKPTVYSFADGTYGGKIGSDGELEITY